MPNPYGNLAGFTDPEQPGWQERAIARVQEHQGKRKRESGGRSRGMYLFFDDPFRVLLDEAAQRRDISLNGYGRRSIAAFLSHDLGIPYGEVTRHAAQPGNYRHALGHGQRTKTQDNGQGHGLWIIEGLELP